MTTPRNKLAGVRLPSGRVLPPGGTKGYERDIVLDSAEIFDPASGQSRVTARMHWPREVHRRRGPPAGWPDIRGRGRRGRIV